jgi:hypothetical protein
VVNQGANLIGRDLSLSWSAAQVAQELDVSVSTLKGLQPTTKIKSAIKQS